MGARRDLCGACLAEGIGTFLLVFFGTGSVFVAVLTGALQGLFQVAIVWGIVIALGIYAAGTISGAHFNPAVTLACAVWRGFPRARVLPYALAQLAGAFAASCMLYVLFQGILNDYELAKGIVRGASGSQETAMLFGEYFPHPLQVGMGPAAFSKVSVVTAMLAEGTGTAVLVFVIFSLTDPRNPGRPSGGLAALFIGLTVSILIAVIAPLTQAGFNPARDFGPRLFAWLAGWGDIAIPGPRRGFFSVYILAPVIGGLAGGGLYDLLLRRFLPENCRDASGPADCGHETVKN
jgi:glycerol uptake facilitator protein